MVHGAEAFASHAKQEEKAAFGATRSSYGNCFDASSQAGNIADFGSCANLLEEYEADTSMRTVRAFDKLGHVPTATLAVGIITSPSLASKTAKYAKKIRMKSRYRDAEFVSLFRDLARSGDLGARFASLYL